MALIDRQWAARCGKAEREREAIRAQRDDLVSRVHFLIGMVGWSEEDTFTFPDGDTWRKPR